MDPDWPRICITLLTVAAFVLSAVGVGRIRKDASQAVGRMERERRLRDRFSTQLRLVKHGDSSPEEIQAATQRWRDQHAAAGLEPHSYKTINDGREPLAERIIVELHAGSRIDFWLVVAGISCGLAASIWSTWLPND
jgi:hypothetical protein